MKLIYIYGPPASGKLTIARLLAEQTGYKVFHNHLTFDLVKSFYEPFTAGFSKMLEFMRMQIFKYSAQNYMTGLIFTSCFVFPNDIDFIDSVKALSKKEKIELCFVKLKCHLDELQKRVESSERKFTNKISNAAKLREVLEQSNMVSSVPGVESLVIENTGINAQQAAEKIYQHYIKGQAIQ